MAQSGDAQAANAVGSNIINALTSPVSKIFAINRGAQEVFARVVWEGAGGKAHGSGHASTEYATLQANEWRVFVEPNHPKIKEFYIYRRVIHTDL